jgi:pimeloyl-ACP methyl ester carboxylesterase
MALVIQRWSTWPGRLPSVRPERLEHVLSISDLTTATGINIHYDTFGDIADPTLLLVNGLGTQMTNLQPDFCQMLVEHGLHVVRFDNRDVGLSSKTDKPVPDVPTLVAAVFSGEPVSGVPYGLGDMGDDAFAVLDVLGIAQAHIAGVSMGGMIVQRMAINQPGRVLSMTSIMSNTGAPGVGKPTPEAAALVVAAPPADRDGYIEHQVKIKEFIGGSHFSADNCRSQAGDFFDRMFYPQGSVFQIAAIASEGDRTEALAQLQMPALVIHGAMDPLAQPSGGEATAAAIPHAELLVIDTMGHDVPEPLWPEITGAIANLVPTAS